MAQTIVVNAKGEVSPTSLTKAVNDTVLVKVDFGLFFGSATASTLTVTADSGITVGTTSVASNIASVPLSGGADGGIYDVQVKLAGTDETKEAVFQLRVVDMTGYSPDDYGFPD